MMYISGFSPEKANSRWVWRLYKSVDGTTYMLKGSGETNQIILRYNICISIALIRVCMTMGMACMVLRTWNFVKDHTIGFNSITFVEHVGCM